MEETNKRMEDSRKCERWDEEVIIFSKDVKALYPSLDHQDVMEAVKRAMIETPMKFANIDWKEAAKYLVVNMSEEELRAKRVWSCIPERVTHRKVSMAYLDTDYFYRED